MVLRPRHALWLLIAAVHLLVLFLLTPSPHPPRGPARQAIELTLLPAPRLRDPRRDVPPDAHEASRPVRRMARPAPVDTSPAPQPPLEPERAAAVADEAPAATAPTTATSLLNSEGTRRAIHLATRAPLLSERAASASDAPARENAQQRFGRAVANSAYGNCLKGEFPGGGMDLLSLPFWIAAEASGKCRK